MEVDIGGKVCVVGDIGVCIDSGYAVDIHVSNSQHRKKLIDYFATKVTGLGVAKTFLHIDLLTPELGFEMRPNAWKY